MLRCMLSSVAVASLLVGSSVALGQAPAKPKGTVIKVDATVSKVVPGQGILATTKDGKQLAIGFPPPARVALEGKGTTDLLAPGTYVQMTVEMDGEVKPIKEVTEVAITVLGKFTEPGVSAKKGPDQVPGEPGPYVVRGTVKTNKNGELTINVGGAKQVTVKLAAAATVPINNDQWWLAQQGDAITGDGIVVSASGANPELVFGERITIKAAMPITKLGKK